MSFIGRLLSHELSQRQRHASYSQGQFAIDLGLKHSTLRRILASDTGILGINASTLRIMVENFHQDHERRAELLAAFAKDQIASMPGADLVEIIVRESPLLKEDHRSMMQTLSDHYQLDSPTAESVCRLLSMLAVKPAHRRIIRDLSRLE